MTISEMFSSFLNKLKIDNSEKISLRYGEITSSLNKKFSGTESKEANSLQVGSYGRHTGIKGISDLDMLYIMPKGKWDTYKDGKQSQLLTDTKDAIKARYPKTDVRVDRLVVTVTYTDFYIEVQPVFEELDDEDESYFKYPDTYNGGSWKKTKPRQEMQEIKDLNEKKNNNLRMLCKMARAWRNKHNVNMGGLLIDTLAYNFMRATSDFDDKSFLYFDFLSRDFFKYLSEQPDKSHYKAPGSNQNVRVKEKFQNIADETYSLCLKAIDAEGKETVNEKWRKVYGSHFPAGEVEESKSESSIGGLLTGLAAVGAGLAVAKAVSAKHSYDNTEEFIENSYQVSIQYNLVIDCDVSQNGFRENSLANMLTRRIPLLANKKLNFKVTHCDVPPPYSLKWKILNRGDEAERRNCVRGQLHDDEGYQSKSETTNFRGSHLVECYAIKNGYMVARAKIDVPIK